MAISEDLYSKMNTLPWQALFEYSLKKGLKEDELKNKDKSQLVKELDNRNLILESEIDNLIEEYIYGNRVTFSLWRFEEEISDKDIEIIKTLEGKDIKQDNAAFKKITIRKVTQYEDRIEIIYIYHKRYHFINEHGKSDAIWEQHQGCSWIGFEKGYLAYIVKHEKMTSVFSDYLTAALKKDVTMVKPTYGALSRIFYNSVMSKIVLQGTDGEKTAISRTQGLTDEQEKERDRLKKDRFNMSGSFVTPIDDNTSATVRYNIKKGNISILKHLSSKEVFAWTKGAINIIFDEIDNLKGKDVEEIFKELGYTLKWSLLSKVEEEKMNWLLTQIISAMDCEQNVEIPKEKRAIFNNDKLFTKILKPYCDKCESYEVPICSECHEVIYSNMGTCKCGAPIHAVCQEGHEMRMDSYWYIPTALCIKMIDTNLSNVFPNIEEKYLFCVMDNTLVISTYKENRGGELLFDDVDEFKVDNFTESDELINYATDMKEKCGKVCSHDKIEKCLKDKQQVCLPKLFYEIIPGFIPQPHKGSEYGDVSGTIHVNGKEYEMKGIIKANSSNAKDKKNRRLLSTSKEGEEIIRQFVEQGINDRRCDVVMIVAPQYIDNSFKGSLRLLARLSNKKIIFVELKQVCKLIKKGGIDSSM